MSLASTVGSVSITANILIILFDNKGLPFTLYYFVQVVSRLCCGRVITHMCGTWQMVKGTRPSVENELRSLFSWTSAKHLIQSSFLDVVHFLSNLLSNVVSFFLCWVTCSRLFSKFFKTSELSRILIWLQLGYFSICTLRFHWNLFEKHLTVKFSKATYNSVLYHKGYARLKLTESWLNGCSRHFEF